MGYVTCNICKKVEEASKYIYYICNKCDVEYRDKDKSPKNIKKDIKLNIKLSNYLDSNSLDSNRLDLDYIDEVALDNYLEQLNKKGIKLSSSGTAPYQAALFYMVKRKTKKPFSLDETANIFEVERKEIGRKYRTLKKELSIKHCENHSIVKTNCMMHTKPSQILKPIIDKYFQEDKEKLLDKCTELGKRTWKHFKGNGKSVYSYSAALVYTSNILIDGKLNQRQIADRFGITENTLRLNFQEFLKFINKDEFLYVIGFNIYNKTLQKYFIEKYPNDEKYLNKFVAEKIKEEEKKKEEKKLQKIIISLDLVKEHHILTIKHRLSQVPKNEKLIIANYFKDKFKDNKEIQILCNDTINNN